MKQMPSQSPTRAATSGPRRVEVKSSSRGGRGARIRTPLARTTNQRPSCSWTRVDASPAACATSVTDSGPRTVHGNGSERQAAALELDACGCAARSRAARRRRRPGRRARARAATRRSRATGSPPMPMLPSASSAQIHRPSPGRWSKTSRCRALAPRARVWRDGLGHDVDAQHARRRGRRGARSSGPGRSRCRGPGRCSARAPPRRRRRPRSAHRVIGSRCGSSSRPCTVHGSPRRAAAKNGTANAWSRSASRRSSRHARRGRARHCRAKRVCGAAAAARSASSARVDVAQHVGADDGRARRRQDRERVDVGPLGRHLHAGQRPGERGSVTASTHQPPSSAAPSTAWLPCPTRSATAVSWAADTCGVSIPICTTGAPARPGDVEVRVREPLGEARRRAARARSSWPAFAQLGRPDCPAQVTGQRDVRSAGSGKASAQTASVSRMQAAARSAAAVVAHPGAEPGLGLARAPAPWPSPGRRAVTRAPGRSRGRRAACPGRSRTPWSGCPRRAGGRRCRAR